MHWRYRLRKQQLLDECEVPPEVFRGGIERLAAFARPFAECLGRREQRDHARTYLAGLVSDPGHTTAESIAYRHGQERHGIPGSVRYRTRHGLALEMLKGTGPLLPHGWVTGDDEMGRSSRSRAELRRLKEPYLPAVPSNTTARDLEGAVPEWGGRGPHPKR